MKIEKWNAEKNIFEQVEATDSDIDEFNNTSIRQKNIIKTKLKNIKNLIKNIKVNNG